MDKEQTWSPFPEDQVLGEEDLRDLLQELSPVVARWRSLGLTLGLKHSTLDILMQQNGPKGLDQLMSDVMMEWLKGNYNMERFGQPSWRRLAEAVRTETGGNNKALADAIASRHCVAIQTSQPQSACSHASTRHFGMTSQPQSACSHASTRHFGNSYSQSPRNPACVYVCCSHLLRLISSQYTKHLAQKEGRQQTFPKVPKCQAETSASIEAAAPTWQIQELTKLRCYHGAMNGKTAEAKLKQSGDDCYLIRYSEVREIYVLTVATGCKEGEESTTKHFKINISSKSDGQGNSYEIEGTERTFPNVSKLLKFYESNALSPKLCNIGKPYTFMTEVVENQL